ncbi:high light inducible protein [Trifolium pratense]|uniref:High light inducible protein n=1 Tax=Trifolium pratense TaxID=57577 RepID=A0A2K3KYZ7_TRIPR|nr:uncharacterized protein LOC123911296 [Trifolium pratense]PNX71510.1 high light inducible protein [Trifolium pratense]
MAHLASASSSSVQLSNPFPLSSSKPLLRKPFILFTTRATEPQTPPSDSDQSKPESTGEDFEDRLNKLRRRSSGGAPGKKAEIRKSRKSNKAVSGSGSGSGSSLYLPPVPLKEAVSDGLKVELGFSKYSEKLNGRIAILGWAALLLVELATGKGVINYHTPGTVIIQLYFVAAVTAIYVKFQKEKISVWPDSS